MLARTDIFLLFCAWQRVSFGWLTYCMKVRTSKSQFAMGPAIQRGRCWAEKSAERAAQVQHGEARRLGTSLLLSQQAKNKSSALFRDVENLNIMGISTCASQATTKGYIALRHPPVSPLVPI